MGSAASQPDSQEAKQEDEKFREYEQSCRYELMKRDLMELAMIFMGPCHIKKSDLESIILEFLPKESSKFETKNK